MIIRPGNRVRVTIELPDGSIYSGEAIAVTIQEEQAYMPIQLAKGPCDLAFIEAIPTGRRWSMELAGNGVLETQPRDRIVAKVRSAVEWRCEFCGAINTREARQCPQCGAPRSFLYDV